MIRVPARPPEGRRAGIDLPPQAQESYGPKTDVRCLTHMADQNEPVHVTTTEARAGSTPGVTRYVLGVSLVLIIAIFAFLILR